MVRLSPADREHGLTLLGASAGRERAKRSGGGAWVGVRADHGVANSGRWAFCVWNETGGNLRVGWSCAEATLKLGTDRWSFGYGGTATKSHNGGFTKYGQTYGQGDAITCLLDLDRRAILYMKNGRTIPGDAFTFGKDLVGWALFPHVYTKEATFAVCFDGGGEAPPVQGGFQWIASAGRALIPSPLGVAPSSAAPIAEESDSGGNAAGGGGFVLTPYGWRTMQEAKVSTQEWRVPLDAYVRHFTSLLESEYTAEREAVAERVQKRSVAQLQAEGVGLAGLTAEFDRDSGRVTLWSEGGPLPHLTEISRGRTVLLSTQDCGVDVDDATKTISGEVEMIRETLVLSTQYERLPGAGSLTPRVGRDCTKYRVDLGPNVIAYQRIDRMLDELQRCLGTAQAKKPMDNIQRLNCNQKLTGLLLPGAPLASALYADISESAAAASKWDPLQRPNPNPDADVSKAARERDIGAPGYQAKGPQPRADAGPTLNASQRRAMALVVEQRRRFSLIQGPPGTGKTTTAVAIVCGWLRAGRGPILATAFSNRGTDNLAEGLHNLGVRVLRMGLCPQELPYSLETRLAECGARRGEKGLNIVMQTIDVVAATCIGSGMGPLDKLAFPYVVVDEAAQVIEPAVLLPLGKGAVQVVMVGDQCQLPATVLSQDAQQGGLDISMFDRLLSLGMEVQLLAEQYRMHPQIAAFPSWRFYRGELRSAVTESSRQRPPRLPVASPVALVHVDSIEQAAGASKKNLKEADCVAWLVQQISQALPGRLTGDEIGIITPYAAQSHELRRQLSPDAKHVVQVSTVDAFQGCEKDVIIVSLVRANHHGEVGFVADWRRLNVALTRARRLCIIVAHLPTWMAAESGLIRDWLGFHTVTSAEVRAFHGNALHQLPGELAEPIAALQEEFSRLRPAASRLPRVSHAPRLIRPEVAAENLAAAVRRKDVAKLQRALAQAVEAGVDCETLDAAEGALHRASAEQALAEAILKRDVALVESAIEQALEVELSGNVVEKGQALLEELDAGRALEAAMNSGDVNALEGALARARASGVQKSTCQKAEYVLRPLAAARDLALAAAGEDDVSLRRALTAAKAAGVRSGTIQEADAALRRLSAALELDAAAAAEDEARLQAAVALAREADVRSDRIKDAEGLLRRLIAAGELREAVHSEDEVSMQIAIAQALEVGVQSGAIAEAQALLRRMGAAKDLAAATVDDDPGTLRRALQRAAESDLQGDAVEEAERALSRLTAAGELAEACEGADEDALARAIAQAVELGVPRFAIEEGERALTALFTASLPLPAVAAGVEEWREDTEKTKEALSDSSSQHCAAVPPAGVVEEESGEQNGAMDAVPEEADSEEQEALQQWSLCILESAFISCRKRKAVELEDFDLAHEVKMIEPGVGARLRAVRRRVLDGRGPMHEEEQATLVSQLAELERRKRRAIEEEDFDLAAELKSEQLELERQHPAATPTPAPARAEELERVQAAKLLAVEEEDYGLAAELKRREEQLLLAASTGSGGGRRPPGSDRGSEEREDEASQDPAAAAAAQDRAVKAARRLLADMGPEVVLLTLDPAVAECAAGAGPEIWDAVAADLKARS